MSAPRRSLADFVRAACGEGDGAADPPYAGADRLSDPDPLVACRLPCKRGDSSTIFSISISIFNTHIFFHCQFYLFLSAL
jgi:hypothetical protein